MGWECVELVGGGGVGLGGGGAARGQVHLAGGADEFPEGDYGEEDDYRPEADQDGRGPLVREVRPEVEEFMAVADADPDGDAVAEEAADGEGQHEFAARHVRCSSGEDEG